MTVRIAHALFTWQDGREPLEAALRSTAGVVDEVLIADGLIDGVPDLGLSYLSDLSWLQDADYLPERVPISAKRWASLSAACTWLLTTAKQLDVDWLLYIDADQELHNGEHLRPYLESWGGDAFPIPRQDQRRHLCPWQCVRVSAFTRYVAGCFILETTSGEQVSLVPPGGPDESLFEFERMPWISHHPNRRPPWRRKQRLGQLETILEPPPPVEAIRLPSLIVSRLVEGSPGQAGPPAWYCDQCGARYYGPGTCSNQHAPRELQADDTTPGAAAADTSSETTSEPADTTGNSTTTVEITEAPEGVTVTPAPEESGAPATSDPAASEVPDTATPPPVAESSPAAAQPEPAPDAPVAPAPDAPLAEAETAAAEAHSLLSQAVDILHEAIAKLKLG